MSKVQDMVPGMEGRGQILELTIALVADEEAPHAKLQILLS